MSENLVLQSASEKNAKECMKIRNFSVYSPQVASQIRSVCLNGFRYSLPRVARLVTARQVIIFFLENSSICGNTV